MHKFEQRSFWAGAAFALITVGSSGFAQTDSKSTQANGNIVARLGDQTITLADVDGRVVKTNMKLAQELFDARYKALNQLILEKALAKEAADAGTTVDAIIAQRVGAIVKPVEQSEVEAFYKENSSQMRGQPLEAIAGRIRQYLVSLKTTEARQEVIREVKKSAGVQLSLEPPRAEVSIAANDPVKGPADAKVTIVEYSDFQ